MEVGQSFASLPNEIIFKILNTLPIKTLLRCRCICKEWNSIITGQTFINNHLLSQSQGYLFCHYYEQSVHSCSSCSSSSSHKTQLCSFFPDASFSLAAKFKVPLLCSSPQFLGWIMVGSLDGLLFLTNSPFGHELHLWNPTIRKYKTLPNSCLFNENERQSSFSPKTQIALGFGFRVRTSDRIIIRIVVFPSRSRKSKSNRLPEAEVYYLSTESWKKVEISEEVSKRLMNISSRLYVNLNDDLNWIATFSDRDGRLYDSILSFDVNNEEFREIRLPCEYINGIAAVIQRIEVYRGSLAVVVAGKKIPDDDGSTHVWLWVMEEYGNVDSWRRTRVKKTGPRSLQGCFILEGKIMLKMRGSKGMRKVVLLDMETDEEREFWVRDFQSVHTFKETLVSVQGANAVSV